MSENLVSENLQNSFELRLREQVAADIEALQTNYDDPKKALQTLSKKSNIHLKTLRRLQQKTHNPGYQTLYKLYSALLGTRDHAEALSLAPVAVQEKLRRMDPQLLDSASRRFTADIEEELLHDRCFAELYVLAEVSPFDPAFVKQRFGDYGLEVLRKMFDLQVLRPQSDGKLTLGNQRASFSAEAIKKTGLQLAQKYLKPERSDETFANHMSFYATALSEKTYRRWIEIDEQAFAAKIATLKEPGAKGTIPAFTFSALDTLKAESHG